MGGDGRVVDSVAVRAEVPVVSERHMEEVPVEVLEAVVVSAADRGAVPAGVLEVQAASEADRGAVPALAAYRTDNTENREEDRAVAPVLNEALEALAEEPACAYGHRKYPT